MYSYQWAEQRVKEHSGSHTRATEFLAKTFTVNQGNLIDFLRNGMVEWETYKGLVRHLELSWGIRSRPNTTEHLSSKLALSVLKHILQKHDKGQGGGLWSGIPFFAKLGERLVWEAEPLAQASEEIHRGFDGQLFLSEGGVY